LGSSGAHIGVGRALVFVRTAVFVEDAEIWVEAATPARVKAMTVARMMVFIVSLSYFVDFTGSGGWWKGDY
jgi:hypothetical protein